MNNMTIKQQLISYLNQATHSIKKEGGVVKTTTKRGVYSVPVSDRYRAVEFKTFALEVIDNTPYDIINYNVVLGKIQQLTLFFGSVSVGNKKYDKILSITSSSNKAVALSLAYGLRDANTGLFILPRDTEDRVFLFKKKHIEKKDGNDIGEAMKEFLNTTFEDAIKAITVSMIELELMDNITFKQIFDGLDNKNYIIDHFLRSARGYLNDRSLTMNNPNIYDVEVSRLDAYSILLNMKRYSDTVALKRYSYQYYDMIYNIEE